LFGPFGDLRTISSGRPPSYSVVPVVGDGKWIWTEPPKTERGYLEPRSYRARVGVELIGTGYAGRIMATTTAPIECAEQKIESVKVRTEGCQAKVRALAEGAAQLILSAPEIQAGQTISAEAEFELTISKQYHGYGPAMFPAQQKPPREIALGYLKDSPGIQTSAKEVQSLVAQLSEGANHPWDKAIRFHEWVPKNITARIGPYTSVTAALKNRVGDCEERSAVFVALCRAVGIPARLVWVPNHNWAEIYLQDYRGKGHWVPVHTSCYSWFGWVGAHELVLQKGDRVRVPEQRGLFRLTEDWAQFVGSKPSVTWNADLEPLPPRSEEDAGPGSRKKDKKGEWVLIGEHPINKYMRR
jgi:transglutaminase-like putative cysteine protease